MKKKLIILATLITLCFLLFLWINSPERYLLQGKADLKRDKVAKAVKNFKEGLNKFPDNTQLGYYLTKSYLLLDEVEKANEVFFEKRLNETLKEKKELDDLIIALSEKNKKIGDKELSEDLAKEYLKNENQEEISRRIVHNHIRVGLLLPERSLELWEKGYKISNLKNYEDDKKVLTSLLLPAYLKKSEYYFESANYDEALSLLNQAENIGKNGRINFTKAKIYNKLGHFNLAQEQYDQALELDPNNDNYKIEYSKALKNESEKTRDHLKKEEYLEKIKLLLANSDDDPRKMSILSKIINSKSKFKVSDVQFSARAIEEYFYPEFKFKITPIASEVKKYKVVFLDETKNEIDLYEKEFSSEELNQIVEVIGKSPVASDKLIYARLFIDNELVKEYSIKN